MPVIQCCKTSIVSGFSHAVLL